MFLNLKSPKVKSHEILQISFQIYFFSHKFFTLIPSILLCRYLAPKAKSYLNLRKKKHFMCEHMWKLSSFSPKFFFGFRKRNISFFFAILFGRIDNRVITYTCKLVKLCSLIIFHYNNKTEMRCEVKESERIEWVDAKEASASVFNTKRR